MSTNDALSAIKQLERTYRGIKQAEEIITKLSEAEKRIPELEKTIVDLTAKAKEASEVAQEMERRKDTASLIHQKWLTDSKAKMLADRKALDELIAARTKASVDEAAHAHSQKMNALKPALMDAQQEVAALNSAINKKSAQMKELDRQYIEISSKLAEAKEQLRRFVA